MIISIKIAVQGLSMGVGDVLYFFRAVMKNE